MTVKSSYYMSKFHKPRGFTLNIRVSSTWGLITLIFLSLISIAQSTKCDLCLPHFSDIIWLPAYKPPCFHPGQPLLQWPNTTCIPDLNITSDEMSVDESGLILAKERVCFYYEPQIFHFVYSCEGVRRNGKFHVGHEVYTKKRREKRWLRRRNPNSAAIHFQQERYVKEMPEDAAVGSTVVSVRASHVSSQPIYYSMVAPQDSRSQNIFTLDTVSGDIRLAKALDREVLDRHMLKVTAYERIDPTVSSTSTVIVEVLDVQDHSPVFERDSYFSEIREDAPIGTTVLSVFARDLDAGENGRVEYSLGEAEGSTLLAIHSKSGVIQTAAPLDRETLSLIRLEVIASDHGEPPRKSTALVEISVMDVNDNAPVFDQDIYNVTIMENATLPATIARVKAADMDGGINGKVHYSLVSSSSVPITIDYSTGEVTLRDKIDARHSPQTVVVRAKDGAQPALSSTVSLTLHILDINDHAPTFIASQKQILVEEGIAIGDEVGRVFAIDEDSGDNGRVRYNISGSDDFSIDPESGIIRTTVTIDRERSAKYQLEVTASDLGVPPLNSTTSVTVIVKDLNDNAPQFAQKEFNLSLSEETPRGSQIIILKAIDKDEDSKIYYRIVQQSKDIVALIDLGDQGALLSLSGELQSSDHLIKVEISATDQGGLQSHCVINIVVEDVNGPPFFLEQPFTVHVPEDSPIGFHVITMKAEDTDRGENALLRYSLESDEFSIDNSSGLIILKEPLDREKKASYALVVTVSDGASPPLNTSTTIEIIVDDVNDNPPVFSSQNYTASIAEDIAVGTSFLQVSAVDFDSGANGIVDYYLNESEPQTELFRMDRTSGTLRLSSPLDREKDAVIRLPIFARDRGRPSLSSTSLITLSLLDVNDNAPVFAQSSYDLYIAENSPVGSTIGTIVATDPDEGENAEMLFRIFGGADAKLFDIEVDELEKGVFRILTRAEFDFEAKTHDFYLEVQASSGQLSSTVPVRIHVSDVNDNRPQLKDFTVLLNLFEEKAVLNTIGSIPAFDPDQNATLEYYLEENDILEVDKFSGKLSLKNHWKRSFEAKFKTCVSDGPNTVCSICNLVHVFVHSDWLRESVTVSLQKMSLDDFWDPVVYTRFRQSIATLEDWNPSEILVLGAHAHESTVTANIVVLQGGKQVSAWKVEDRIRSETTRLERMSLMRITVVRDESCAKEPCPYYQKCRQTLKYINDVELHETDNFLARTIRTVNTFVCECPEGFTSSPELAGQCDVRLDGCFSSPCKNNGTCYPLEEGYRCECTQGWRGAQCEISLNSLTCLPGYCMSGSRCELSHGQMGCKTCRHEATDSDSRCRLRSLSFGGDGIVNVHKTLGRIEWEMKLSIATISTKGTLLFSGDRKSDFLELSIHDRTLRAEFSLGGKGRVVKMESERSNRINDGEWHTVTLRYYDKKLTIFLGECDPFISLNAHGATPCAAVGAIDLPAKCLDPTVPCFRFLDLSNGIFLGGRPGPSRRVENAYTGCLSNLTINNELIDFSNLAEMDKQGSVEEGCGERKDYCSQSPCTVGKECVNKWKGRVCRCTHGKGDCQENESSSRALSLLEDESFVLFDPEGISVPFSLSFEFRTSRSDTQIIVAEFDRRNVFYKLEIEDGQLRATVGQTSVLLPVPEFTAGHWVKVEVDFNGENVITVIDGIYTETMDTSVLDMSLDVLYTGLAPSTGHPSRYQGCMKDIMINGENQVAKEKGKVRHGCLVPNRCSVEGVCPKESVCHRQWNRHTCKCHTGFAGDTCLPVCSLSGVCGAGGLCQSTNSSIGYECQCMNGQSGINCDHVPAQRICPTGWWGSFPNCKRCECSPAKGFLPQCSAETGQCVCQKSQYSYKGRCVSCECGLGATSLECSAKGQCVCNGQSTGRRCDRCPSETQVLDPRSLKCTLVRDRCPSQIEYGIQWPTTLRGAIARQSCPGSETGLATRSCGTDSKWREVNNFNCTRPEYGLMVNKFDLLDSSSLLTLLENATEYSESIRGRNMEIAASAMHRVLDAELRLRDTSGGHARDVAFTEAIVLSASRLLSASPTIDYLSLLTKLHSYGKQVFMIHEKFEFLQPFQVASEDIVFSIDNVDFSNVFPKFNNFLDRRHAGHPRVQIHVQKTRQIYYSILPYPKCRACESPLVSVVVNSTEPIRVEFPLKDESGWRYPECVKLHGTVHWTWSTRDSILVGLNQTHAVCEFFGEGIYTIITKDDKGAYLRLSHTDNISSPVMAGIALLLCTISLIFTLSHNSIRTQLIRTGFIVFFILNMANIYFIHKISVNQVFCPVRNAVLSFTTSAPFAWLFLYSLHLYRMLADGNSKSSSTVCLLLGIVFPCLLASCTFFLSSQCSLLPSTWLFWLLVLPIGLFLLLSFYASATCLIVSMNKQYDVYVVKFNLRKALFQHFVLTALTLSYVAVGLFLPLFSVSVPLHDLIANITLVVCCLYILVWSFRPNSASTKKADQLWVEPPPKSVMMESTAEPNCESPLLPDPSHHDDFMPDVIPSDPFLTSTPIQRVNSERRDGRERERPDTSLIHNILSPADKILSEGLGHVYGNMGTLPRLRSAVDDADDAYYSYTASRRYQATTFNS